MSVEREPLFSYCLILGGREFAIRVTHEGVIHWDDYQERRAAGTSASAVLMMEPDEFTVSFELDPDLFAQFQQAAAMFEANAWTEQDESRLDTQLVPLFWERVNDRLLHPLARPSPN